VLRATTRSGIIGQGGWEGWYGAATADATVTTEIQDGVAIKSLKVCREGFFGYSILFPI